MLSPSDRQILRAAAVLGGHFDPDLLHELLEEGITVDDAVWARLEDYVTTTAVGRRFIHGLIRDAAYEGLSFRRRKELHARAARAIEARTTTPDEGAELLSLHWLQAEGYEQAWHYSRLAGQRARALWANADAAIFYERALKAAGRLRTLAHPEVMAVAEALGDACELTGSYERARAAYAQASRLGGGQVDRARLLRKTGVVYERQGRYRQALACYTRGRRLVESPDGPSRAERSELDLASAGICSRQGRHRECRRFAEEAASEAAAAGHRSGLAHALYLEHVESVFLGEPEDEPALRALGIFEEIGDLLGQGNVLNNLGIAAYYRGDWVGSLAHYEKSRGARTASGDVVGAATEENNIAEILSDQGELEAARALFESARATWSAAGYPVGAALATSNLGRLEARAGELARGRELLEVALSQFREIRSKFTVETEVRLAECELLGGDFEAAVASSGELLAGMAGRPGLAQAELTALRVNRSASGFAAVVSGTARPGGDPSRELDEAVARAEALEVPYELALCLAARSALAALSPPSRQSSSTDAADQAALDRDRARAIFEGLGVSRAVITWSRRFGGAPVFACGASPDP